MGGMPFCFDRQPLDYGTMVSVSPSKFDVAINCPLALMLMIVQLSFMAEMVVVVQMKVLFIVVFMGVFMGVGV